MLEEVPINLPDERDQLSTRALPEYAGLRTRGYESVQRTKHVNHWTGSVRTRADAQEPQHA